MFEINQAGDVLIDGEVTAEGVEISIRATQRHSGGLVNWYGSFQVSDGQPRGHYARSGAGSIALQDGRSGQVIFENVSLDTGVIQFQGSGPLE